MHVEPDQLSTWWGPKGFTSHVAELDVRVGRTYRISMQPPAGEPFAVTGEFLEVEPPHRLAYTFRWEPPDPDDQETVAELSLTDADGLTQLTVDQGTFRTAARLSVHQQGWSETIDRLSHHLSE
jgi:uncharacterized protein YndB with AHSA1/START domain